MFESSFKELQACLKYSMEEVLQVGSDLEAHTTKLTADHLV